VVVVVVVDDDMTSCCRCRFGLRRRQVNELAALWRSINCESNPMRLAGNNHELARNGARRVVIGRRMRMRTRAMASGLAVREDERGVGRDEGRSDNGSLTNRFDCLTRMISISTGIGDKLRNKVGSIGHHVPSALRVLVSQSRHVTIRKVRLPVLFVRNVSDVVVGRKGDRRMPAHRRCGVARTSVQCSTSVLFRKSSFPTSTRRLNA
jgi:hypothetical protein